MITNFASLVELLEKRGIPHVADPRTQVIESPLDAPPLEGNLYLRWEKERPFLQIIHLLAYDLPLARLPDLETACCRANAAIALAGFGIDYTRRNLYYHQTLAVLAGVPETTLERALAAVVATAIEFLTAFHKIVAGEAAGYKVIELAKAAKQPA